MSGRMGVALFLELHQIPYWYLRVEPMALLDLLEIVTS